MGKSWRGGGGRGGGRGGGGAYNDLGSCRGLSIIVATSDTVREREATKELMNLLEQAIEDVYDVDSSSNDGGGVGEDDAEDGDPNSHAAGPSFSIQDMLAKELSELKSQTKAKSHHTTPIKMDTKGLVVVRINKKQYDPVVLLKWIFDKVKREGLPCSRHLIRLVPLQRVFSPNIEEVGAHSLKCFKEWVWDRTGTRPAEPVPDPLSAVVAMSAAAADASLSEETPRKRKFVIISDEDKQPILAANKKLDVVKAVLDSANTVVVNVDDAGAASSDIAVKKNTASAAQEEEEEEAATSSAASAASTAVAVVPRPIAPPFVMPACLPTVSFGVLYKARNHNVLTRLNVIDTLCKKMPFGTRADYKNPQVRVLVEAIKNICGVSVVEGFEEYSEFNLRKFQAQVTAEGEEQELKIDGGDVGQAKDDGDHDNSI